MAVLPDRIGRYQVIDRLAVGGMAEIFLGRLSGPSGFQRLVVIKRALPHLSYDPQFVEMFLDEARIVARIRHPNVVQVHELGEDSEMFLAMEYLEGESVQGVLRRLHREASKLDPRLAAHIVAEACRGLHAAHELQHEDGRSLGVVHRDVSPQNIFVSYEGGVKVLDFGIAKAADHASRTEPGTVRGKFAYMSPEQCLGRSVDRRSDVFSLGIVLHELLTQQRLFRRESQLAQMKAICEDPIPSPRQAAPWISEALADVCMRALEHAPDQRFATCRQFRKALIAAVRSDGPLDDPDEALRELMHHLFDERIQEKRELVQQARTGMVSLPMPKAEADDNIELPALEGTAPLSAVVTRPSHEPVARSASRSVWAWGAVVALVAVAATGLALRRTTPESAQAPTVQAVVQLSFEAKPGGTVYIDGRAYGDTPTTVELPRADKPLMVEIRRPGHVTSSQRVVPSVDQRIVVVLEPLPAPTSTPSAVPSPAPNRAPVYRHRPPPRPSPPAASSAPKRVELL